MEIPLNDIVLIWVKILHASRQKNSPTLRCCLRFRYKRLPIWFPSLLRLISKLLLKFSKLCWQKPRLWEEFVLLREDSRHSLQVPSEMVLSSQGVHSWKMVDSLVGFHSVKFVDLNCTIGPQQVPLVVGVLVVGHVGCATQTHLKQASGYVPHNVILCLGDVQHELFCFEPAPFLDYRFIFFCLCF